MTYIYSYKQQQDGMWRICANGQPLIFSPYRLERNARFLVKLANEWVEARGNRTVGFTDELTIFVEICNIMKERGMEV